MNLYNIAVNVINMDKIWLKLFENWTKNLQNENEPNEFLCFDNLMIVSHFFRIYSTIKIIFVLYESNKKIK